MDYDLHHSSKAEIALLQATITATTQGPIIDVGSFGAMEYLIQLLMTTSCAVLASSVKSGSSDLP